MSPTLKKALLIILLLVVALLIGYALYRLFVQPPVPTGVVTPAGNVGAPGQLPAAGQAVPGAPGGAASPTPGGLPTAGVIPQAGPSYYQPTPVTKVSPDFAVYPSLNQGGAYRYHNAADGKFYKVMPDGTVKAMTDQVFYNVSNVTWAGSKDEAVLEYPDGSNIVYNFEQKTQVTLPAHWQEFSFSPDGGQIAAKSMGLAPENRWLVATNDNGTGTKLVEPMGENSDKVTISWSPSRQVVGFSKTADPIGGDREQILLVGLNHENFKALTVEGLGFQPEWSPTGQKLLYSVYSQRSGLKPELWIANAYGDQIGTGRQMLNINTWADKCSFASDSALLCAVPRELPEGAGMSPEIATDIYDDLYKIDLKTGVKTQLPLGGDYTINNISFDTSRNKVIFTDAHQTGVFEASL